jgi:pilus assembly protein CpaE
MDVPVQAAADPTLTAAGATALVFVQDKESEGILRQCLSGLAVNKAEFKTGGVNEAIATLAVRPSPRLLVVDVHGLNDPIGQIRELANVCDPATGVIVIGEFNDIRLYRELKSAGVVDYYYTPLVLGPVMQSCKAIVTGNAAPTANRSGKLVFVVSVRGGCGGTTIAVATAWHLAEVNKRRVCLLDLDLQFGDAALQLDATPSHALQEALRHPERIDDLFLDRATAQAAQRLGVMAALEPLNSALRLDEDAVLPLLQRLLKRNRYVFVDVPARATPGLTRVLHLPGTVLLVSNGSLASARDVARLRERLGANSPDRTTLHILNRQGTGESLSVEEFARAAGTPADIVMPFAREIAQASRLGVGAMHKNAALQKALTPLYRQLSGEEPAAAAGWSLRKFLSRK